MIEIPFRIGPPVTSERLKAYANASGDLNPIHLDESVAKRAGLPGVIAHGMLSMGFLAERGELFMRTECPDGAGFMLKKFQTRFKAMTFIGDTVTVGGTAKREGGYWICDLVCKNQRGEVTTTAQMTFAS